MKCVNKNCGEDNSHIKLYTSDISWVCYIKLECLKYHIKHRSLDWDEIYKDARDILSSYLCGTCLSRIEEFGFFRFLMIEKNPIKIGYIEESI